VLKCQKEAKKDSLTEMLPSELGAGTQQTKTDLKDLLEISFSEIKFCFINIFNLSSSKDSFLFIRIITERNY
jgi:hypothetical protein